MEMTQEAKQDRNKPRLTLVPMEIVFDIARIREYGCAKYPNGGTDNWKQVEPERYREAAFRHFLRYLDDPYGVDDESGLPHRWHLECNLAFLAELEKEVKESALPSCDRCEYAYCDEQSKFVICGSCSHFNSFKEKT